MRVILDDSFHRIPSAVVAVFVAHESRTHTLLLQLCAAAECVSGRLQNRKRSQRALPFILPSMHSCYCAFCYDSQPIDWKLAILG